MKTRWTDRSPILRTLGALSFFALTLTGCDPGGDPEQDRAEPMIGTVRAQLGLPFTYSASNTNSANQNTTNGVIALTAGQTLTVGTCGVSGASSSGDTFLRLYGPGGLQVASNDDACGGVGSSITYTVPSGAGGTYEVRAGCYSSNSCGGTVSSAISGGTTPPPTGNSLTYTASNTNDGSQNTVNQTITLNSGQSIVVGTCGVPGSSSSGDNRLRLYDSSGYPVVVSSGSCDGGWGGGTYLAYTVPSGGSGSYQLRAGCAMNQTCGGTVVWRISPSGSSFPFTGTPAGEVGQTVQLAAGQTLSVGTCGMSRASISGDSKLRILGGANNWNVATNDNACGGDGSHLLYTVPAGAGGSYTFYVGCNYSSCGGTVVWSVW